MTEFRLLERFSTTVERIYAASLNPSLWPDAVKAVAQLHGSPKANLLTPTTPPARGGFIFPTGFAQSDIELWGEKYVEHDIWAHRVVERNLAVEGNVILGSELVTEEELEKSIFYRDFLSRHDTWHLCTGIVFDGSAQPLTAMSLFKGRAQVGFSSVDRSLYKMTVNHLSRSLGTMFLLRDARLQVAATLAALDRMIGGVLLFGPAGNVIFANRTAVALLACEEGLRLRAGNPMTDAMGWLAASDSREDSHLTTDIKAIVEAKPFNVDHFSRGHFISRRSKRPLFMRISTLATGNEFSRGEREARGIAFVTDPDDVPRLNPNSLRRAFALTDAECTVAQEVLMGDALHSIAGRINLSENTVKTHLQSIYQKTNTHRQAELVRLLMGLASIGL
jgi:DNA-binding CsgD family transcriptional regulator